MDISPYIDGWRERARREEQAQAEAVASARQAVPAAAEALRRHGARRIWLIGSLPRGTFRPGSDLDFTAEGMSEDQAWRAAKEAAKVSGHHVDVIRAESLDPEWRRHHERFGEPVDV
ncbi:MAG: nucleotidyltransferase domain-containing protein [Myxococcales bacterium]|nr:nucleotidyltransferase domain-containing protein [Myxococcales bacterium]